MSLHVTLKDTRGKTRRLKVGTDDAETAKSEALKSYPGAEVLKVEVRPVAIVTSRMIDAKPLYEAEQARQKAENAAAAEKVKAEGAGAETV